MSREKKNRITRSYDEISSSPHLCSLSSISQRERASLENYISTVVRNPGLTGVLKLADENSSRTLPVAFIEGHAEPVIIRPLHISSKLDELVMDKLCAIQSRINTLEVSEITLASSGYVLKRTYMPLTLDDLLFSKQAVKIETVLSTLVKLFHSVSELYKHSLVHGHIHPGNVVFGGSNDGLLIDYGVSIVERPNRELNTSFCPEFMGAVPSHSFDSYGLGYTLKRVLHEVRLQGGDSVPHIETLQSSFLPLISALMNRNAEKRPDARLARLMFNDILPMVCSTFEIPSCSSFVIDLEEQDRISSNDESHNQQINTVTTDFSRISEDNPFSEQDIDVGVLSIDTNKVEVSDEKKKQTSSKFIVNLLFVILLVVLCLLLYRAKDNFYNVLSSSGLFTPEKTYEVGESFEGPYFGYDKLRAAWASQVPSRMKLVARQAVYVSEYRELAEQVILTSLRQNEISSQLVDKELLRVAFHDQWEDQLDETDRRYALSLGLIGLLRDTLPPGLGKIEDRHAVILLSILSAGNSKTASVLMTVPAEKLEQLPSPYGAAFQILIRGREGLSCGDSDIISMARFATRGIESSQEVHAFLSDDFKRKIGALAVIFSYNTDNAKKLVDTILYNPNFSIKNEFADWARETELDKWGSLDSVDQLFLLSGVPIKNGNTLDAVSVAKLFLHPSDEVRAYAIKLGLDKIEFKHPSSLQVFRILETTPSLLTPEQLVLLAQILEDPARTLDKNRDIVHRFVSSNPPLDICKLMIQSTAKNTESSPLDAALTMYLAEKGWVPSLSDLVVLSEHPDRVTRMFTYKKLFELDDKEHALLLLKGALEKEKLPEYKDQLSAMIQTIAP